MERNPDMFIPDSEGSLTTSGFELMTQPTKQSELEAMLNSFRLPSFNKNYHQYARQAEKEKLDHVDYLYQLAMSESEDRYNRKTERLIRQAKLLRGKVVTSKITLPGLNKITLLESEH